MKRFLISWYESAEEGSFRLTTECRSWDWHRLLGNDRIVAVTVEIEAEDELEARDLIVQSRGLVTWRSCEEVQA